MLCASKGSRHINYGHILDDNTSYDTIKNLVIKILEEEKNRGKNEDDEE